ncbi:aldose 1-epimerase [Chitinophaga japonensis]|uniref:Aldose 1-epimerase n=1 Tax=Chitinophaga japonensis TaxID=104662 RepID=A0A562T5R8_CHIJA|nr:aldose 1-epimerase [Chitinophaga japonensis]TWI88426.1 aldose 1-epimerase [Chitinophaga japonensis]
MPFSIHSFQHNGFDIIALKDDDTGAQAEIIPACGAMLHAFKVPHQGQLLNIIDSYGSLEEYRQQFANTFKGVKLSPFACRIPGGEYQWQQQFYRISKTVLPGQAIHGLLYDAAFTVAGQQAADTTAVVELAYAYQGTDAGYPFPYDCRVRYRLLPGYTLEVSTTLANRAATAIPVMDGWHPYFTTGRAIDGLELRFSAEQLVEFNDQLVPTGRLLPCTDYLQPQRLEGVILDNSFMLRFDRPGPLCTLQDPQQGIAIDYYPGHNYPILQVYTPPERRSIAIEHLSGAPNAFNNGMGLLQLAPGEEETFTARIQVRLA